MDLEGRPDSTHRGRKSDGASWGQSWLWHCFVHLHWFIQHACEAESARAITGRRCPHSGDEQGFLKSDPLWTSSSDVRPAVPKFRRSWKSILNLGCDIGSNFCQKSPFRRKSRVSQGHKISAKFLKLRKLRKLRKFRYVAIPRFSQRWNYCPKSENP